MAKFCTAPKKKSKAPLIIGGAVALVVLIAVIAFSGREDSGVDPGGNNRPTHSAPGSASGFAPAQPTESQIQQPSGNVNPDLIGVWGCGWNGVSHYYHFRADGTFYYRNYHGGPSLLFKGNWRESGGTVYLTNRAMIAFNSSDVPDAVEYMAWTDLDDETMLIRLGVIGDDEYSSRYFASDKFGLKYFYNPDIFDDGDGSLPRAYRSFTYDNAPNWAFPYRIFEYDAAGNYVGYADGY